MLRKLISSGQIRFSAETFLSAVLALALAQALHMQVPFWSFVTVYIVANPTKGLLRAKAVWRVIGTAIGAAYSIVVLDHFAAKSLELGVGISVWVGTCIFFSLVDRAPRNYAWVLAAYTVLLIIFPSLVLREPLVDTAFARTAEVLLGCTCAWMIAEIGKRERVTESSTNLLDLWIEEVRVLTQKALLVPQQDISSDLLSLSLKTTQVHTALRHTPYEAIGLHGAWRTVLLLESRMNSLIPIVAGLSQRLAYNDHYNRSSLLVARPSFEQLLYALKVGCLDVTAANRIKRQSFLDEESLNLQDPATIAIRTIFGRVRQFLDAWVDIHHLKSELFRGITPLYTTFRLGAYIPVGEAIRGSVGVIITVMISYGLWKVSNWEYGGIACMMAVVASSIAAGQPNAVRSIGTFLLWSSLGVALGGFYIYIVNPHIHQTVPFLSVLALAYLPLGALLAKHSWSTRIISLTTVAAGQLAFQSASPMAASVFGQAWLAHMAGVAIAAGIGFALMPFSSRSLNAMLRKARRDIVQALCFDKDWSQDRSLGRLAAAVAQYSDNSAAVIELSAYHRILFNACLLRVDLQGKEKRMLNAAIALLKAHFSKPHGSLAMPILLGSLREVSFMLAASKSCPECRDVALALAGIEVDLALEAGLPCIGPA
jgi:uncharacterized membrane protein YccC